MTASSRREEEKNMADALKEAPRAEAQPSESSAGVVLNRRYMAPPRDGDGRIWARATALVQASANELYSLWRDIESAPKWQEMITDVIQTGPKTSHWVMKAGDEKIEWDSEILADEPGRRIAWRSVAGESDHAGEVVFEPAPCGRGTIVVVLQEFRQGKVKTAAETIFSRNPKHAVIESLGHFKALAESGEISWTKGQPHGPRGASGNLKASVYGEKIGVPRGDRKTG
jgi:uncharacterized membrane protein